MKNLVALTLTEVAKNDMLVKNITERMASDKIKWRKRILVDP
jgi:hypothetical protein